MQGIAPPSKLVLNQDNSKLKQEVNSLFQRGDLKWNTGATLQEKNDGINFILQGLKTLKIWISRETDQLFVQTLQNQYNARYQDIEKKLDYIEKYKNGEVMTENPSGGLQMKKGADGKEGKNEEKDKLQDQIAEAIVSDKPNVKWTDIAGLTQAKAALQEAVILPIRFPQIFEGARKPWKGILLYGPPGTGKTFLAKACATEADGTFFSISSSDLISKYVGESEKLIKALFGMARNKKPSIIFIDEIDSMCGSRGEGQNEASRRVITEFLVQMDGVGHDDKGILVLGATNLPWLLDSGIRRRFEKRIYIPLPDSEARAYMIKNALKKCDNNLTQEQIDDLGVKTEGYSGSDISVLVKNAVYEPVGKLQQAKKFKTINVNGEQKITPAEPNESGPNVKEMNFLDIKGDQLYVPPICYDDFLKSLKKAKSSVSSDQLQEYDKWTAQFGQEG